MTKKPTISIIAAIGKNRELGKNNQLLWHIPEDMIHFKTVTEGHPIIMGENTFYSIGRPLPNRTNVVLSLNKDLTIPGCIVCHSINEAIKAASANDQEEIFFIGGGQIYKQSLPLADKLYLTLVDISTDADTFFPEYEKDFKVISKENSANDELKYSFVELVRK